MHPPQASTVTTREILLALALGSLALLPLGVQPIILGALVDGQRISMSELGVIATVEIIALGAGVALSEGLLSLQRIRGLTLTAALALSGFDALSALAPNAAWLAPLRAAAGLCGGTLVWATTSVIVRSPAPARVAGWFFALQTIAQAVLGATLAEWVLPRIGAPGAFALLAALSLPCAALGRGLTPRASSPHEPTQPSSRLPASATVPLLATFLQFGAAGALWAYLEPLSRSLGFSAEGAQLLISGVLLMQVLGALSAAVCVQRLPILPALLAGSGVLAVCAGLAQWLQPGALTPFALACAVFGFVWLALPPFQVAWSLRVAGSERASALLPAAQLIGTACGPLTCAPFMTDLERPSSPLVSAAFALAACAVLIGARGLRTANPIDGSRVSPA